MCVSIEILSHKDLSLRRKGAPTEATDSAQKRRLILCLTSPPLNRLSVWCRGGR